MRKISIIIILCMLMTLLIPFNVLADTQSQTKIAINGDYVEFNDSTGYPFVDSNSRTQVPFRVTLEKFGAKVSWDNETRTAIAEKNGIKIEVPIGKSYILKNGEEIENDTKALIKDGRTYLPIRAVVEAFGATVGWEGDTKTVVIKSGHIEKQDFKDSENNFEIHIIASEEDMANGIFKVEYWEKNNKTLNREYNVGWEFDLSNTSYIQPYILEGTGTYNWDPNSRKVTFNISNNGQVIKYGYVVSPIQDQIISSYISDDFAILASRNLIDGHTLRSKMPKIQIVFDVPSNMQVLAPWEKINSVEERYLVVLDKRKDEIDKSGNAVWGIFDEVYEEKVGNNTLVLFNYKCDESYDYNAFKEFTINSYKTLMTTFTGIEEEYFAPKLITGFVPKGKLYEEQYMVGMNFEGYRGAWILELNQDYKFKEFLLENRIAHCLTHWSIDDDFIGYWSIEGIADFAVLDMEYNDDSLKNEYLRRFKNSINLYNEVIVANDIDIPLMLHLDNQIELAEERYKIKITDDGRSIISNPDWKYYLDLRKDYNWTGAVKGKHQDSVDENFFVYDKSQMIFYIMNEIIKSGPNKEMTMYDFLNRFYSRVDEVAFEERANLAEKILEEISGKNMSGFFNKYVFDNQPLPIKVENDEIIVTY